MKQFTRRLAMQAALLGVFAAANGAAQAPGAPRGGGARLPDGPGRDTTQRVCGSTCHGPEIFMTRGSTRDQWGQVLNSMVTRGAKISDADSAQIVEYLATTFPPGRAGVAAVAGPTAARGPAAAPPPGMRRGPFLGPDDAHIVDNAAADRGKLIYIAECITCHGNKARGPNENVAANQRGSDLVRSLTVLHDRYGSTIVPFLKAGHPMQSGGTTAKLTSDQGVDMAHFLHQRVGDTLRSGPYNKVLNVLTGDAKAGAAYFNGAGGCKNCHSPTGDLAGIGQKYDPPTLQQRFLFPRTVGFGRRGASQSKPVTVTVTTPDGKSITGVLDKIDDFNVSLRDSYGDYHSWKRTAVLKIEKHDPYAKHVELLDQYTDKNMHDIVAYLETLK